MGVKSDYRQHEKKKVYIKTNERELCIRRVLCVRVTTSGLTVTLEKRDIIKQRNYELLS